jgi:hypothetical protein
MAELMQTGRIVPVVIFLRHGARPGRLTLGGEHQCYLDFHYIACDLYRLEALDYIDSDNLVIRLNLPNMAYPASARLDVYAAALAGLATLENDPNRRSKYADFIDYYADLSEEELNRYTATYLTERGDLMGLAQQLRQEGRKEGRREGIPQGEVLILRRQLGRRFGPLPAWAEQELKTAPPERLETIADRILDADSLDAVFHP